MQQQEIRELQKSINTLSQSLTNETVAPSKQQSNSFESVRADHSQEIAQLKATASQLASEIATLEKLKTDNQKLRTQLATPVGLSPEETEAMAKAKERAERIACVNNLKQLGLAVRIWSTDNADGYPPDVVCMSNEMSTTKILICPTDHDRQPARDFGSFTMANCSYEWFLNGPPAGQHPSLGEEPTRVLTRCPIHRNIGLYDGSVLQLSEKSYLESFVTRDGKLYHEPK